MTGLEPQEGGSVTAAFGLRVPDFSLRFNHLDVARFRWGLIRSPWSKFLKKFEVLVWLNSWRYAEKREGSERNEIGEMRFTKKSEFLY